MKRAAAVLVALAALGMARTCTGLTCLEQPYNVTVHIVDINIVLKWKWDNPCGLNVTFSTQYLELEDTGKWSFISECHNVAVTECDISSTVVNYFSEHLVNVRVNTAKNHSSWASLSFVPYLAAQIGPPEVWLESISGNEKINILHPDKKQSKQMWGTDHLQYMLTIWKNSSHPEEKPQDVFPGQFLQDLEPDTVYCLKVKAYLFERYGLYSPVYCKRTPKAWVGLPVPENVRLHTLNMKCLLHWDGLYGGNVSFLVQCIPSSIAVTADDISKEWHNVTGCENVRTLYCDLSPCVHFNGIYYFRVQAVQNHNKSPWSKMLRFEPKEDTELGPPSVKLNASGDSITVFIASPTESENKSRCQFYELTYYVWYWPNSSHTKKKELGDKASPPYVISGLTPATVYCLQAQGFVQKYNKSSKLSNIMCIETTKGTSVHSTIFIVFVATLVVVISLTGLVYCAWRQVKYAFFPKCNPPVNIESIGVKHTSSSYLLTSEKPTEDFVVIVDSIVPNEATLTGTKDHKESEEISRDSGNYSTEDDIFEKKDCYDITKLKPV